jgi:hypothetical protein
VSESWAVFFDRRFKMNSGKFSVVIELGNDRMRTRYDIACVLQQLAKDVMMGRTDGIIRDINGNTVGKYELETD